MIYFRNEATPNEKRKWLILDEIQDNTTEKIAQKYRKLVGIQNDDFEFLVIELGLPSRNEVVEEILSKEKISKAFREFWNKIIKEKSEYKYLISQETWKYPIAEIFFFGEIQRDTLRNLDFSQISWVVNNQKEKALFLKILPNTNRQQIIDFLKVPENDIKHQFKKRGILSEKTTSRTGKSDTSILDLWVRVLDKFSSEQIKEQLKEKFPEEYKKEFLSDSGKSSTIYRLKYGLIASYVFHRFKFSNPKGKPFKADYIKAIIEKAKKNNTQIRNGLFKKIP